MAFEKGNKHAAKAKVIEAALRRAITQDDGQRIRNGVEKLLDLFADGDLAAFQIVANRLDGMPMQHLGISDERDPRELTTDELAAAILRERANSARPSEEQPSSLH